MDRRNFVKSAMYFTVASATVGLQACGGSSTSASSSTDTKGKYKFNLGVASGDPKDKSVVFWTQCVNASGAKDDIALKLEVSTSAAFTALVASVSLTAGSTYDFTVRAKVTNLTPATTYYYRFVAGSDISAVGTSKTTPANDASPDQLRFAWFTCQDWSINHWGAMELLAQEELDFVVHLGDYIYETVGASFQKGAAEAAHTAITLPEGKKSGSAVYANSVDDYRTLYKTYRSDARLQAIHAKWPMIAIWDDHEFSDDCWQDHQTYTNQNAQETPRRRAATQAWAEYMPIDFGDVSFDLAKQTYDNIRIYRDFKFGNLMHLVMTDQRLYRDDHIVSEATYASLIGKDPVNGSDSIGSRYFVPLPWLTEFEKTAATALQRNPGILGTTQTQWWKDTMKASTATWKVWGNEVTLNRMFLDMRQQAPAPYNNLYVVSADVWDGYPKAKADVLSYLKTENIKNVVAITGDFHAFQCGVVRDTQDTATGTPVLVDFVAAGISSDSFYNYLKAGSAGTPLAALVAAPQIYDGVIKANNPDFAYLDHDAQGYAVATVTASNFTVWFKKVKPLVADGSKPAAPLLKTTKMTVTAGTVAAVVQDNV